MKIKHTSSEGYLKSPRFTTGLNELIENCANKMENIDSVTVNVIEIFPHLKSNKVIETFVFSEDGKAVTLNITSYKGEDKDGKFTITPKPKNLFRTIEFLFSKMQKEHNAKFSGM